MRIEAVLAAGIALGGCATNRGQAAGTIAAITGGIALADIAAQRSEPDQSIEHTAPQLYVLGGLLVVTAIAAVVALDAESSAHDAR
jgi:hypothetical protein